MRGLLLPFLAGLAGIAMPAGAEPLFLRIRPAEANDDAAAAQGRALREEVWARSDRRARIAIASVCTGCLTPTRPAVAPPAGPNRAGTLAAADTAPGDPNPTEPPPSPTEGAR